VLFRSLIFYLLTSMAATVMSVIVCFICSRRSKSLVLVVALIAWSICTGLTGLYKGLVILFIGQLLSEGVCYAQIVGLIAACFPANLRATAISIITVGNHIGFQLVSPAGNKIAESLNSQAPGFVFGSLGLVIGALVRVTAKNPAFMRSLKTRTDQLEDVSGGQPLLQPLLALHPEEDQEIQWQQQHREGVTAVPAAPTAPQAGHHDASFKDVLPSLILLAVAGGVRRVGVVVLADQTYQLLEVDVNDAYLVWIPFTVACCGVACGGWFSDRIANRVRPDGTKWGPQGRLLVVVVGNFLSAALVMAGLLVTQSFPWGCLLLAGSFFFGDMWFGNVVTVILEITPTNMHTTSVAIFVALVEIIGNGVPVLVQSAFELFEKGGHDRIRNEILLLGPGTCILSSAFFALIRFFAGRGVLSLRAQA